MEKKNTVLITGSSRGIGAEMAKKFAEKNYNVVINYFKSKEKAEKVLEEITRKNGSAIAVYADMRKAEDVQKLFDIAIKTFGKIDVLVNNCGIAFDKLFIDSTLEDYSDMMDTNFKSSFMITKLVLPQMISNNFGKIINISSVWGQTGGAMEALYSASKGAVIAFTKALAKEYALSGITVNAIAPGIIDTDMLHIYSDAEIDACKKTVPMETVGETSDVAEMALFLASNSAKYITGQVFAVNGGFYC